jgi:lipopolysaccharide/colanic/teichoic acid biosynthesis glycosyltransferase
MCAGELLWIKRWLDMLTSAVCMICLLPLFVVVSIAVCVDSPGAPFFLHTRVGRDGRRFKMVKFRSMFVDGDKRLNDPEIRDKVESAGRVLKFEGDPRITRVGKLIRSTSIDELPQLINVLMGHMSIVGPRALMPSMLDPYPEWAAARSIVRPGITGLWQISARERNESLEDMIDYDLEYIRNWSILGDLMILAKTPGVVLSRKGAV